MYNSEIADAQLLAFCEAFRGDDEHAPKCEYRHAQWDGGSQTGGMIQCRNKAAMWTDRGLRCEDHKGD